MMISQAEAKAFGHMEVREGPSATSGIQICIVHNSMVSCAGQHGAHPAWPRGRGEPEQELLLK